MAGRGSDAHARKYVHSPPSPRSGLFLGCFYFPFLLSGGSTNSIFEQCSLLSYSFLCCCGAVFYAAVAFNGDLSTWQVEKVRTMRSSTFVLRPPSPRSGLFLVAPFFLLSVAALIPFLNNALSSFFPTHFYLGLFFVAVWCSVLECWCLQW